MMDQLKIRFQNVKCFEHFSPELPVSVASKSGSIGDTIQYLGLMQCIFSNQPLLSIRTALGFQDGATAWIRQLI